MASDTQGQRFVCPFPRSWYPKGSPCSQTDEILTGPANDPFYTPSPSSQGPGLLDSIKFVFWTDVVLVSAYLVVRGFEAYGSLRRSR